MTQSEFIERMVGVPWVRWGSDFSGSDCYGVVILYHREVLCIDLGAVPERDIGSGFAVLAGQWVECAEGDADAVAFMAWRDGSPTHCGIVLPGGMCLHSEGHIDEHGRHIGSVRLTPMRTMRRAYGTIRLYRHTASHAPHCP